MEYPLESYIDFIFGNDGHSGYEQYFVEEDNIENELIELELAENSDTALDILHTAFNNIDNHLHAYSAHQLSNALDYIFNPSLSNIGLCFQNRALDDKKKLETLQPLFKYITHTYNQTAEAVLGHLSEAPEKKENKYLNSVCYMFWDTACIPYNCGEGITLACLEVMKKCARSSNIAVVEGAVHGLGHMIGYGHDDMIRPYIDAANFGNGPRSTALRKYAESAKIGMIQ